MARENWFPITLDGQQNHFMNVQGKISSYEVPLAMDIIEVNRILAICDEVLTVIERTREAKMTLESLNDWRTLVLEGPTKGVATTPPQFTQMPTMIGLQFSLYAEYKNMVAKEKLKSQYTTAIGEDLGWIGAEKADQLLEDIVPEFSYSSGPDFQVTVKGKMQGMDGARIDFRPASETNYTHIAQITGTPATFTFTPTVPGQPEKGDFRARFIKKNVIVGQYSQPFTLVITP